MKKLFSALMLVSLLLCSGCSGKKLQKEDLIGKWICPEQKSTILISLERIYIYPFDGDGSFTEYELSKNTVTAEGLELTVSEEEPYTITYLENEYVRVDDELLNKVGSQIKEDLAGLKSDFDFCSKYAGNVNGKGSRKFADSFTDRMSAYLSVSDEDLNATFPEITEEMSNLRECKDGVVDFVLDMGRTNSDEYVQWIKWFSAIGIKECEDLQILFNSFE